VEFIMQDETIEDLQCKDFKLIQKKQGFRFGLDSVLLADFATIKNNGKVVDLGTGTGIVPILLCAKKIVSNVIGVEIQPHLVEMANRSVTLNNLQDKIKIIEGDIKNLDALGRDEFDAVVSNPPYIKLNTGIRSVQKEKDISRHEVLCNIDDIISTSSKLLKDKGYLNIVHKPERLADIICSMRKYQIEPKFIRFVHPNINKKPNIVLIKGVKRGGQDLKFLKPLLVYDSNYSYSTEINKIYGRGDTEQ
jgi:tRNA1(Val) A37 N6-methylase TrmN6